MHYLCPIPCPCASSSNSPLCAPFVGDAAVQSVAANLSHPCQHKSR
jgi:hypothetical protein